MTPLRTGPGLRPQMRADLIRTVAAAPTPVNVAVLGLIVLIRRTTLAAHDH